MQDSSDAGDKPRTLLVFPPIFGLPSASPYSTKAMILLTMAGLDFRSRPADPRKAPKGKLPVLIDGGRTIPDSHFIRRHLEREYGHDFDAGLDARERAVATAMTALVEDRLYWVGISERWLYPENKVPVLEMLGMVPAFAREFVRRLIARDIRRDLRGQGMGRHSREEALEIAEDVVATLAAQLGDRPFMMGNEPTGLDATAYPMLAGCMTPAFETRLRDMVAAHPTLVAYCARMGERFPFPTA